MQTLNAEWQRSRPDGSYQLDKWACASFSQHTKCCAYASPYLNRYIQQQQKQLFFFSKQQKRNTDYFGNISDMPCTALSAAQAEQEEEQKQECSRENMVAATIRTAANNLVTEVN